MVDESFWIAEDQTLTDIVIVNESANAVFLMFFPASNTQMSIVKSTSITETFKAVMLANTQLCLAFYGFEPGFPVVDAALVHVDALYAASVSDPA